MRWIWIVMLLPGAACAEPLTGPQIAQALTARVLGYDNGARQDFKADGRTLYQTDKTEWGRWRVQGDQYCSQWPPSDRWSCYGVTRDGPQIGFVAGDGSVVTGRYIDRP
jgi:hypothetical protein